MDVGTIIITIIAILAVGAIGYTIYNKQVSSVNIMPIILVPITLFTAYLTYYKSYIDERSFAFELTEKMTVDLYDRIVKYHPYSSNFYNEINPTSDKSFVYIPKTPEEKNKYEMVNFSLSTIFIDLIAEFHTISNVLSKDSYNSWISAFKIWFKSNILREAWNKTKNVYEKDIQKFVDTKLLN